MSIERIKAVVEQYRERLRGNIMEDGRMRWEYYGVQRRIAQAAYNYNGYIVTGTRHSCPIMEMQIMMMEEVLEYNTPQRVSNVISKIGAVTNKDFGKILGLTTQDLLEEYTKETERDPKQIAESNWKSFLKLLQSEIGKEVRSQFVVALED